MKIWDRTQHKIQQLIDIIKFNNFFTLDIKDTDGHLTRTFSSYWAKRKRKETIAITTSMEGSQKEATQTPPIHVHMPFQPRHSLYKDLSITVNHHVKSMVLKSISKLVV